MAEDVAFTYTVTLHLDDVSCVWAEVEELPGCFASGANFKELWEALGEAVSLYLSTPENAVLVRFEPPGPTVERVRAVAVPA